MESILQSIKKLLGITDDYTAFDPDIIMHINSVFSILSQIGVGPPEGFSIMDSSSTWSEFLPDKDPRLNTVKSYIHLKVRLLFDPPTSSAVTETINRQISEFEWRLNVAAESKESED